jgi:L-fucose dehydrogenase
MDLGLKDRVIVVTGGASGIGEAITRACLAEGAIVVIVSLRTPTLQPLLDELNAQQLPVDLFETNLSNPAACKAAIDFVQQKHGRLDGLVNNAGLNDGIGLESGSPERFLASLRDHLVHYYSMAHYALPLLKASRGSIVNISSKVAVTGQTNTSAYAACKAAQLGLTREWAAELLPYGIRVNAVIPAEVKTPAYATWISNRPDPVAALAAIERHIPLGQRMTSPEEIAATVAFLLSPTQSTHTTAQLLHVDGGYVHLDRALT